MLVIAVKPFEKIQIGETVLYIRTKPNSKELVVSIDAPKEIKIIREFAKKKTKE